MSDTPWRAHVAAAYYLTGMPWHHISIFMGGITRQRIFQLIDRAGVSFRWHDVPDAEIDAALQSARRDGLTDRSAILEAATTALPKVARYRFGPRLTALVGTMAQHVPPPGQERTHGWCVRGQHFAPVGELVRNATSGGRQCRECRNAHARMLSDRKRRAAGKPSRAQVYAQKSEQARERALAHIAAWRASGLTQTAYCAEQGLSRNTFVCWRQKYDKKSAP